MQCQCVDADHLTSELLARQQLCRDFRATKQQTLQVVRVELRCAPNSHQYFRHLDQTPHCVAACHQSNKLTAAHSRSDSANCVNFFEYLRRRQLPHLLSVRTNPKLRPRVCSCPHHSDQQIQLLHLVAQSMKPPAAMVRSRSGIEK